MKKGNYKIRGGKVHRSDKQAWFGGLASRCGIWMKTRWGYTLTSKPLTCKKCIKAVRG
jgi:hypothetical protein